MFIIVFNFCFDKIFNELFKARIWISFSPLSPCCDTNVSLVVSNEFLLYPGVFLELVPVGGDYPGERMSGDHKGDCVLELVDVGQSPCPRPEDSMESEDVLVVGSVLDVGNKDSSK